MPLQDVPREYGSFTTCWRRPRIRRGNTALIWLRPATEGSSEDGQMRSVWQRVRQGILRSGYIHPHRRAHALGDTYYRAPLVSKLHRTQQLSQSCYQQAEGYQKGGETLQLHVPERRASDLCPVQGIRKCYVQVENVAFDPNGCGNWRVEW